MKRLATLLILILFLLIHQYGLAQNPLPKSPCVTNPVYRQFDFWIGEWDVYGKNGKKAGDSRIERMLDSCIILENWTSGAYSGKSYNTFNGTTQKWQQYWVDNAGGVTEYFDGHYEDGKMIFQTANVKQFDGKVKIMKMTFFNLGADKVRQFGESSVDNGKTWTVDFDLEYRRK